MDSGRADPVLISKRSLNVVKQDPNTRLDTKGKLQRLETGSMRLANMKCFAGIVTLVFVLCVLGQHRVMATVGTIPTSLKHAPQPTCRQHSPAHISHEGHSSLLRVRGGSPSIYSLVPSCRANQMCNQIYETLATCLDSVLAYCKKSRTCQDVINTLAHGPQIIDTACASNSLCSNLRSKIMSLWKSDSVLAVHTAVVSIAIAFDLVSSLLSSARLRPVDTRRSPGCIPHSHVVTVGSRVRVKGLTSARQYNGLIGIVRSKYGKRFAVEVWGFPEDLMLKSKNLEVIGSSPLSIEPKKTKVQEKPQDETVSAVNITAMGSDRRNEDLRDSETASAEKYVDQTHLSKVKGGPAPGVPEEKQPKSIRKKTFGNYFEKLTGFKQTSSIADIEYAAPKDIQSAAPKAYYQGWLYSREPALLALWHKRWCVVRQGQLDLYEDDSMQKLVMSVPLSQCRIEKTRVLDGRLQQGCDFEYGIRVVLGKGILMELGAKERVLAAGSEEERE
eukprot:766077-Hanusia_phi.AAC.1